MDEDVDETVAGVHRSWHWPVRHRARRVQRSWRLESGRGRPSTRTLDRFAKELGVAGPVTIQNSYSLVSRGVDNDLAEVLFREKMSLLAYSPLAGGMLSGKYLGGS